MLTPFLIFIGTYTRSTSEGIYAVHLDPRTGALTGPELVAKTTNPSFLALAPDLKTLYAVSESDSMAVAFATQFPAATLRALHTPQPSGGAAPCHLVVDRTQRTLVVANYHTAIVAGIPILPDATLGTPNVIQHTGHSVDPVRQTSPHVHSVTLSPDNRFVIVCDLGLDRVFTYRLDPAKATLTLASSVQTAPGTGPRHFAFGHDGRHAYVVTEMGSTVVAYDYDAASGALKPLHSVSTLPAGYTGASTCAEIRVHPNGRFVYASNRGHDSIAVFAVDEPTGRLTPVEVALCGGKTPRNFAISPDGAWMVCANQGSDSLTVLKVDPSTGRLTLTPNKLTVPMPVCVLFPPAK
jgi:6-phosphogluconolactonase